MKAGRSKYINCYVLTFISSGKQVFRKGHTSEYISRHSQQWKSTRWRGFPEAVENQASAPARTSTCWFYVGPFKGGRLLKYPYHGFVIKHSQGRWKWIEDWILLRNWLNSLCVSFYSSQVETSVFKSVKNSRL